MSLKKATVAWSGSSESREPGQFLNPLGEEVAARLAGREVAIDLRSLEYMNSSTVVPLINLVKVLAGASTHVSICFAEDREWQQTHLRCMRMVVRSLGNVTVEGLPRSIPSQSPPAAPA